MAEGYRALGALQGRMGEGGRTNAPVQRPPMTNAMRPPQRPPAPIQRAPLPPAVAMRPNPAPPGVFPSMQPPTPIMQPQMGTNAPPAMSNYGTGMQNAGANSMMFNMLPAGVAEAFGATPPGYGQKRPPVIY
jgi:hypothetical protein